jgi:sporulation protein YlmC with PRC-barrel domain
MKNIRLTPSCTALALSLCLGWSSAASAQVVGVTTTIGVSITEMSQLTYGLSAKKNFLGKAVFNEVGTTLGEVEDLILSPDKNVSYLVLGAGGFLGVGRHDVVIPMAQIKEDHTVGHKLIWAGATVEGIRTMPRFDYVSDITRRDQYIAKTEQELSQFKIKLVDMQRRVSLANESNKAALTTQYALLQQDFQTAETGLADLKRASVGHWQSFESAISSAIARLKLSLEK